MPEHGDSSGNGLPAVVNIASFIKTTVNRSITSNVVAKQHGGLDGTDNLALACHRCNLHKGPNLTGIDSVAREIVALFHPRRDRWADHFAPGRAH
jgi:hypothetical protein